MYYRNKMRKKAPFIILAVLAFLSLGSALVMLLWNAILPDLVGVKRITFLQSAGLLILSKILFGGFGGSGRQRWQAKKKRWRDKWQNMSEEEKQRYREAWKERCKKKRDGE